MEGMLQVQTNLVHQRYLIEGIGLHQGYQVDWFYGRQGEKTLRPFREKVVEQDQIILELREQLTVQKTLVTLQAEKIERMEDD